MSYYFIRMNVVTSQPTTMTVAKESLAMAEQTGDKTFQRMALAMMALTGIGTLLHAVHNLYRDIHPKRDTAKPPPAAPHGDPPPQQDFAGSRSHNARTNDRPAESERRWTDTISRQGHGRHR